MFIKFVRFIELKYFDFLILFGKVVWFVNIIIVDFSKCVLKWLRNFVRFSNELDWFCFLFRCFKVNFVYFFLLLVNEVCFSLKIF